MFLQARFPVSLLLFCSFLLSPAVRSAAQSSPAGTGTSRPTDASTQLPAFDVVSIHENKSGTAGLYGSRLTPDGVTISHIRLTDIISWAYGVKQDSISGAPGWVDDTDYDIEAKVAPEDVPTLKQLSGKQRFAMLRPVLAERFHLQAHIVPRVLPVYDLVIIKGGPKFKQSPPLPGVHGEDANKGGIMRFGPGTFTAQRLPIKSLVDQLSFIVHRTVIDETGLTGPYDFTLKYEPETSPSEKPDNGSTDSSAPSIFTALPEQLGLKLQPGKGPVDTLVIDHVEKPTEN